MSREPGLGVSEAKSGYAVRSGADLPGLAVSLLPNVARMKAHWYERCPHVL